MRKQYGMESLPRQFKENVVQVDALYKDTGNTKRYKYLSHLPQGAVFHFVEIELARLITNRELIYLYEDALYER